VPIVVPFNQPGTAVRGAVAANECIVIEDSHWGLQAGKAAGMHTIAVTNSYDAEQLTIAEKIVAHLNELTINDLLQLCS
jgi:beta-phosphoglucomutase-like phosphatase (HAD superfamily)